MKRGVVALGWAWVGPLLAGGAVFQVSNTSDSGAGSFRDALLAANTSPPPNQIVFNIPGPPPYPLLPIIPYPAITNPVSIRADFQSGFSTQPVVFVIGVLASNQALLHLSGVKGAEVRGLDFRNAVTGLWIDAQSHSNLVTGCWFRGLPWGAVVEGSFNVFGEEGIGQQDVFIQNTVGLALEAPGGSNRVVHCAIGNNPWEEGTTLNANGTGVLIRLSHGNAIRGATNTIQSIAGNLVGVRIQQARDTWVSKTTVGLAISNNTFQPLPNLTGLLVELSTNTVIGGEILNDRNVISGNASIGVLLYSNRGTRIAGNYFGLDPGGTQLKGSAFAGIYALYERELVVGGPGGEGNYLAGQDSVDLLLGFVTNGIVQGNHVGLNRDGNVPRTNELGIAVFASAAVTVGGAGPGKGNWVCGHEDGIQVQSSTGIVVAGNLVGLNPQGLARPNTSNGIYVVNASSNLIGGITDEEGNRVAYNGYAGIAVATNIDGPSRANRLWGNLVYSNGALNNLDLGLNGPTANDASADADTGANNIQNHPIITNAFSGSTYLWGYLRTQPGAYRIEFFAGSTQREARLFLGATNLTVPANFTNSFALVLPRTAPTGSFITATATDADGNTSEFGAGVRVAKAPSGDGDGLPDFWESQYGLSTNLITIDADPDDDDISTYQEYYADTNPVDGNSYLQMTGIAGDDTATLVAWTSRASRVYRVQSAGTVAGPWTTVASNVWGNGGIRTWTVATGLFHRVTVGLPSL